MKRGLGQVFHMISNRAEEQRVNSGKPEEAAFSVAPSINYRWHRDGRPQNANTAARLESYDLIENLDSYLMIDSRVSEATTEVDTTGCPYDA